MICSGLRAGELALIASLCLVICGFSCSAQVQLIDPPATSPGSAESRALPEAVDLLAANTLGLADKGADNLDSLLHWAIENSDPNKLAAQAAVSETEGADVPTLQERRERVKELMAVMASRPTETQLMKEVIGYLQSSDSTEDERLEALNVLQQLSEPIDNANDLKVLNGIPPIVEALGLGSDRHKAAAAHVIGTAASNNPKFQEQVLEMYPDLFVRLLALVVGSTAEGDESAVKGLYAVATLVRNLDATRMAFYAAGGVQVLQSVLQVEANTQGASVRLQRKALSLLMDLVQADPSLFQEGLQPGLPAAITSMLSSSPSHDNDAQEKTMEAMRLVLQGAPASRDAFLAANAGPALQGLQARYAEMYLEAEDSDDRQFVGHLQELCLDVQTLLAAPLGGVKVEL